MYKGIEVGKDKVYMSHLQFTDDALFFGEWSLHNAKKIGNGCNTLFWLDTWIGNEPLKDSFPRLFKLKSNPLALVCDRAPVSTSFSNLATRAGPNAYVGTIPNNHLAPRRPGPVPIQLPHRLLFRWVWNNPLSHAEIEELTIITEPVSHLHLNNEIDKWVCPFNEAKSFNAKGMRLYISKANHPSTITQSRWNKYLPSKVNISTWTIKNRRLPTRLNLDKRGVDLHSIRCPICDDDIESENHLFVECIAAKDT
ncbi:RNA-directed DNA polymerase, eukaryota, reverse transcriptase zinc-binding domain protein [Tanacetum coccineum]